MVRKGHKLFSRATGFQFEICNFQYPLAGPLAIKHGKLENPLRMGYNIYIYNRNIIYTWEMFHCHLWLPEGSGNSWKFKAKYHSCLFLGPCRVLQFETQSRTKCAAVCKMCIFWCYDYINIGNSIVAGFVNEALFCSGFIEKLRLEYTEYTLGSRTILAYAAIAAICRYMQ